MIQWLIALLAAAVSVTPADHKPLDVHSLSNPDMTITIDDDGTLTASDTCTTITGQVELRGSVYIPRQVSAGEADGEADCDTAAVRALSAVTAPGVVYEIVYAPDGSIGILAPRGGMWTFAGTSSVAVPAGGR